MRNAVARANPLKVYGVTFAGFRKALKLDCVGPAVGRCSDKSFCASEFAGLTVSKLVLEIL